MKIQNKIISFSQYLQEVTLKIKNILAKDFSGSIDNFSSMVESILTSIPNLSTGEIMQIAKQEDINALEASKAYVENTVFHNYLFFDYLSHYDNTVQETRRTLSDYSSLSAIQQEKLEIFISKYSDNYTYNKESGELSLKGTIDSIDLEELKQIFTSENDIIEINNLVKTLSLDYKNFYLLRDSFSLFLTEKIKDSTREPSLIYLSKKLFDRLMGTHNNYKVNHSEMFKLFALANAKVKGEPIEDISKLNFLLLFQELEESYHDSAKFKEFKKAFFDVFNEHSQHDENFRFINQYFFQYFDKLNILEIIQNNKIRFIDTTEKGTFVLYLEASLRKYLAEKGLSQEDIDNKVSSFMFYSYTFPAFSYVKKDQEYHDVQKDPLSYKIVYRLPEVPNKIGYPIELALMSFVNGGDFVMPQMLQEQNEKKLFAFALYVLLLRATIIDSLPN
jgi:hypothetical protein